MTRSRLLKLSMPALIKTPRKNMPAAISSAGKVKEEISVNAPDIVDLQAERYGSRDFQYRYNVTSVVVVTSGNVSKVNELISWLYG